MCSMETGRDTSTENWLTDCLAEMAATARVPAPRQHRVPAPRTVAHGTAHRTPTPAPATPATPSPARPAAQDTTAMTDPATAERLARLAARRTPAATTPAGANRAPAAPGRTTRRRKPAKGSKAMAFGISLLATGGLTAMFAHGDRPAAPVGGAPSSQLAQAAPPAAAPVQANDDDGQAAANTVAAAFPTETTAPAPAPAAAPAATATPRATPVAIDGAVSENRWGPVQVRITVAGGHITDITPLALPNDRRTSVRINDYAAPILRSEAITAQGAGIYNVSGATYTSTSYAQSLQSAIDQAIAQGTLVSA